jgi:glycine/D-amino acid oxidase-like deaminating enzyme
MPDKRETKAGGRSWWLEEALAAEEDAGSAPLQGTTRADVCIIGGGYTGLWTAIRLKELDPALDVVLLEADICGGGASGRNGGMALSWWPKIETLIARVGHWEAFELARESERHITELGEFCEREGLDVHFRQGGWIWSATSTAQVGAWSSARRIANSGGTEIFEQLTAEEIRARLGSPVHLGGLLERSAAIVQPALLARGLRTVAERRGVRIHEHSPVTRLDVGRRRARTAQGEVVADAVVVATNAWSSQLHGLRSAIVPISSDVVATEPIPELLERIGWTGGESVSNSRLMVDYYRPTRDGRVVFGRGGGGLAYRGRFGDRWDADAGRARVTADALRRLVPALESVRITHAWGGAVDRSTDGLPFVGRVRPGAPVVYAAGLSGNGVAPCALVAKIVASTVLGRDDRWSGSGLARGVPGRFPPEPIRYLGGRLVREAVRRKEDREEDGLRVDWPTRRLAGFAPSGFFKIGHDDAAADGARAPAPPPTDTNAATGNGAAQPNGAGRTRAPSG